MQGRLAIFDYEQSMLVWHDLPKPGQQAFGREVQAYRAAAIWGRKPKAVVPWLAR